MKKLMLIATLALCGCDVDSLDAWEYHAAVPLKSSTQELMAIESTLRSNGYVRVRFITHYGWSDEPTGITVVATRKEEKR